MKVSLFQNNTAESCEDVELLTILVGIRIGKWRNNIEALRALGTEEQKQYKNTMLPCFNVSATYTHSDENGINLHSRYAFLDAHKKYNEHVDFRELRERTQQDSYTYSCFLSWNEGLAIIVKIPDIKEYHEASYRALKEYYEVAIGITLDKASSVACPCYISWDPNLYLNQDSDIFEVITEVDQEPKDTFHAAFHWSE